MSMLIDAYRFGGGGGGGGVAEYNTYVSGLSPDLWWRCNETSGTTLANSGSASSADMTTVGSPTLNVGPASGFPGIGAGISFDGSTQRARTSSSNNTPSGSTDFTIIIFVSFPDLARTNDYLYGKGNAGDLIFGYTASSVEFFTNAYTGSDPRTGSAIAIPNNDVHMVVYRRSGTTWEGYLDDANVFSVSRTFGLTTTPLQSTLAASAINSDPCQCTIYDMQVYARALSAGEMTGVWDKARGL